jgi:peptidoglycan/xylan/chitin deacetylase (PgdA/CDA1 family)
MGMPGLSSLIKQIKRPLLRMRPKGMVLLYHRVADVEFDPQLLCVSPRNFKQHLEVLGKHWVPASLTHLSRSIYDVAVDHRAVAVTFDDGYADNLYNAKPLLERYGVPATVFVSSGYVGQSREFWWDELERLLLGSSELPREIALSIDGQGFKWTLDEAGDYDLKQRQTYYGWNLLEQKDPTQRHRVFRALCDLLRSFGEPRRTEALSQLRELTSDDQARRTHSVLSCEELCRLADGGLVEIGSHTVNHVRLSALPRADQEKEIEDDKKRLEGMLGRGIDVFSYPFGSSNDYTNETVKQVRQAGFQLACANYNGLVVNSTDRFQVPRLIVRDWDGPGFARRLERWFNGFDE